MTGGAGPQPGGVAAPEVVDFVAWDGALSSFATYLSAAAAHAHRLEVGDPWRLEIDHLRLSEDAYRATLVAQAAAWRGGRKTSTVYVLAYDHAVPASLVDPIVADAQEHCLVEGKPRAFAQRGGRPDSRCLYVGHSLKFDERLRQHLGDGPRQTSALNLKYWDAYPDGGLHLQAYAFADEALTLARMLEEYLWDTLKPLLGRRGGR